MMIANDNRTLEELILEKLLDNMELLTREDCEDLPYIVGYRPETKKPILTLVE